MRGSRTRSRKRTPSRWSTSCWNVPGAQALARSARARRRRGRGSAHGPSTKRSSSPRRSGTDRQPSLIGIGLVADRLDHGVDHDGQRDRRLVRDSAGCCRPRRRRSAAARRPGWPPARRRRPPRIVSIMSSISCWIAGERSSSAVTSRARSRSTGSPTMRIGSVTVLRASGSARPRSRGHLHRALVARVGVAHHAHARVGRQHALELLRRQVGAVGDAHHARVDRAPDADAAAVVDRDPRRARCGVHQRVEQRPVGDRVGLVGHALGLAVGRRDRARVEVVAADHDRRLELAAAHHLVEAQPEPVALAVAEPADPRRQSLEGDPLARLRHPAREPLVVGELLEHRAVGRRDVGPVARQRDPAERALALAEQRPDVGGHEAGVGERALEAAEPRLRAQAVAVVEDLGARRRGSRPSPRSGRRSPRASGAGTRRGRRARSASASSSVMRFGT